MMRIDDRVKGFLSFALLGLLLAGPAAADRHGDPDTPVFEMIEEAHFCEFFFFLR